MLCPISDLRFVPTGDIAGLCWTKPEPRACNYYGLLPSRRSLARLISRATSSKTCASERPSLVVMDFRTCRPCHAIATIGIKSGSQETIRLTYQGTSLLEPVPEI